MAKSLTYKDKTGEQGTKEYSEIAAIINAKQHQPVLDCCTAAVKVGTASESYQHRGSTHGRWFDLKECPTCGRVQAHLSMMA